MKITWPDRFSPFLSSSQSAVLAFLIDFDRVVIRVATRLDWTRLCVGYDKLGKGSGPCRALAPDRKCK